MKVTRIKITAYRGVEQADVPIGDGGVLVKGPCESGKTSFLDALRAALVATGVDATDIRRGHDRAEILVTADAERSRLQIKRRITQGGNSVTVSNQDGFKMDSPQTRLREMLGGGGFDPVDFFLAKPANRRRIILDASPVAVSAEDLSRWIPAGEVYPEPLPNEHGLETLARIRKAFYDRRAEANKSAKAAADDADRYEQAAAAVAGDRNDDLLTREAEVAEDVRRARAAAQDVEARERAAARARETSGEARTRIEGLRRQADEWATTAADARPGAALVEAADRELQSCAARVAQLRHELEVAEQDEAAAKRKVDDLDKEIAMADRNQKAADDARRRADELEATLASAAPEVPEDEAAAARAGLEAAEAAADALRRAQEEQAVRAKADDQRAVAVDADARAAALDAIVKTLTDVAPRELAARGNLIPGFDVETMSLDGVPLDTLSGGQKLEFAVRLAKRANPEAKILICDGLERLDPERMEAFVKLATEGGWQLIASRVEAGGIQFEAIEPDAPAEAAAP